MAFKFLLHFVGDIHQPLHAADHFDSGGSCVRVQSARVGSTNLHSYWDSAVVAAISPDPYRVAEILEARLTQGQIQTWAADSNPASWANDAYAVARSTVYNQALIDACANHRAQGTVVLGPAYEHAATNAAAVQLAKAGVRLAALLNGALR